MADRRGARVREVRALAPRGVDTAFDGAGGPTDRRSLDLLAPAGHLAIPGITSGLVGGRRSPAALTRTAAGTFRPSALGSFSTGLGIDGYVSVTCVLPPH